MNKLLAIGLACCLPTGLAAEDPTDALAFVATHSLVIEESVPVTRDVFCARNAADKSASDCMAFHRAVLTARMQKVSTARTHGRWM